MLREEEELENGIPFGEDELLPGLMNFNEGGLSSNYCKLERALSFHEQMEEE